MIGADFFGNVNSVVAMRSRFGLLVANGMLHSLVRVLSMLARVDIDKRDPSRWLLSCDALLHPSPWARCVEDESGA